MDIDIDFSTTFDPLTIFKNGIRASMVKNNELVKHPAGVYLQSIPIDPITNLAAIPYEKAEQLGYFKIDFLHLSLLDNFETKHQIRTLLKKSPDWELLEHEEHVSKLFQLHRHFSLVSQVKPQSVEELADCIALIRPRKRALLPAYLKDKNEARRFIYRQGDDDKSAFRKSHAIAYSLTIVLQLHLIKGGIL